MGYGDSWGEGRQKGGGTSEIVASTKRLTPSGLDERLIPKDGGLNFGSELVGYRGEGLEELLLALLGATT